MMIEKLFLAGADVFRLNFSHGLHHEKKAQLEAIRALEVKYDHPIAVLGDLQGPKLRVGSFSSPDGVVLSAGDIFTFDLDSTKGDKTRVQLPHPEILAASEVGHVLYVDDGKIKLTVVERKDEALKCVVNFGGRMQDKKGVNTPDSILRMSPLTPKDRKDLQFMLDIGVDWVALSFVQRPEDVLEIKQIIRDSLPPGACAPNVMSKIEKPSCFQGNNLADIVSLSDGVMVARGDLGVECPPETIPLLQREVIEMCRSFRRPVVVATQMLESMIESPTPTRAEASDVATAIYDGADAVMLSAESAAGKYPVEAVAMQQKVINAVEKDRRYRHDMQTASLYRRPPPPTLPPPTTATTAAAAAAAALSLAAPPRPAAGSSLALAVVSAARDLASSVSARLLVSFTCTGSTALLGSAGRPSVPILAITPHVDVARKLSLSWGVYSANMRTSTSTSTSSSLSSKDGTRTIGPFEEMLKVACRTALRKGMVDGPDDVLVVSAGLPFGTPGAANVLRVVTAAGPNCWDGLCTMDVDEDRKAKIDTSGRIAAANAAAI